jgi:O-antigen/teichoic acid export membrane protein
MADPTRPEIPSAATVVPVATTSSVRVARNTLVNFLRPVMNIVVGISMTPFLLHRIGATGYGIYVLAASFSASAGYLSLGELGLQGAVVRFVARDDAQGRWDRVERIVGTTMSILFGIGLLGTVALLVLSRFAVSLFNIPADSAAAARFVFAVIAFQVLAEFAVLPILGYLEGLQRFATITLLGVGQLLVYVAILVPLVLHGAGVRGVAVAAATSAFLHLLAATVTARVQRGHLRPRFGIDRASLPELTRYSWRLMVIRLTSVGYDQMDKVIVGVALSPAAVAVYQVANNLHLMARYGLSLGSSALTPVSSALAATADEARLRALLIRGTRSTVALAVPISVSVILLARPLIEGWVGPGFPGAIDAARLFVVYILFTSATTVGVMMLIGMGEMDWLVSLGALSMGINLAVSVALVNVVGVKGVIVGTTVGYSIVLVPYLRLILRRFEIGLAEFARQALVRPLGLAVGHVALLAAAVAARPPHGFDEALVYGGLAFAAYLVAYVRYGADASDRMVLRSLLRRSPA